MCPLALITAPVLSENTTEARLDLDLYKYEYEFEYTELSEACISASLAEAFVAAPVVFAVVVVLSLLGNTLVLVILGLYETLKSTANIFILNLAVSDLIFTLGLPFWSSSYVWGWTFGEVMCKGMNFVSSAGFYSSTVFLMLLTIQHYIAVVHPQSQWNRMKPLAVIPIFAWVVSFTAASPDFLHCEVVASISENSTEVYCAHNSVEALLAGTYRKNLFFVVTFLIVGFCCVRILQANRRFRGNDDHTDLRGTQKETKSLVFCIALVFFVFWAPYNIVIFLQSLHIEPFTTCEVFIQLDSAFFVCRLLAYSHCCLNPVIYVLVVKTSRNHLRAFQRKIFQQQDDADYEF
ncbi:chemokine XC receptor 1-like [Salminus brasiliensis]|uniref:chemokine XC receptor 1-like n=1 Tax=Salminus brasiliensis TaxID=930266 RepID=UPI003B838EA1